MRRLIVLILVFFAVGFDFFRLNRPVPSSELVVRMPVFEKQTLPSGAQLLIHTDSYLPLVHIRILFLSGESVEPENQRGVLSLLFHTIVARNEPLRSALDSLGASPQVSVEEDSVSVSVQVRSEDATAASSALLRAIIAPQWNEAAFKKARWSLSQRLADTAEHPKTVASIALVQLLFPKDHPWGRVPKEEATHVQKRTLEEVQAMHRRFVVSKNLSVAIAGRILRPVASAWVKKSLTDLAEGEVLQAPLPTPKAEDRKTVLLLPFPGLSQSVIVAAKRVPPEEHEDAMAIEMAASWLSTNAHFQLRENKTVTYGVSANYQSSRRSGVFTVRTAVETKHTGYAAREIASQIFSSTTAEVNSKLLPMYRAGMVRNITETSASLAGITSLAENIFRYGADYWQKRIAKIQTVSHIEVYKALRDHVQPGQLEMVIAGDPTVVIPQLREEGFKDVRLWASP